MLPEGFPFYQFYYNNSNSHFTNNLNFDMIGLRRVEAKVAIDFATSLMILH